MASYSFLDLAEEVLISAESPLTYQEIWDTAKKGGLTEKIGSKGKTPWQTLGAQLYVEVRDSEVSRFVKVGKRPARFFLKSREGALSKEAIEQLDKQQPIKKEKATGFHERDLHPVLTYFLYSNPAFNRGRSIFTKTIYHEKSLKSGYNEWVHPDMVDSICHWMTGDLMSLSSIDFRTTTPCGSFRLKSKRVLQKPTIGNHSSKLSRIHHGLTKDIWWLPILSRMMS